MQSGFAERHYGDWQGSYLSQLQTYENFKQQAYSQPDLVPCIGAESTASVRTRMTKQLISLSRRAIEGNILVICHGDAIDCLLSMWTTPLNIKNCQHVRLIKNTDNFIWDKHE